MVVQVSDHSKTKHYFLYVCFYIFIGPSFFSKAVVNYIFSGLSAVSASISDISDPVVQELVLKV